MAREYTITFDNIAIAAAQDLWEILPADDKPIAICGITLDNVGGAADAGDAQEEMLRLAVVRGHTTTGLGGTLPTPTPLSPTDAAASFTAEMNNTTIASAGSPLTLWAFGWNVRMGLREFLPQELWLGCTQTQTSIAVRLLSAPADGINVSGTLWVAEIF